MLNLEIKYDDGERLIILLYTKREYTLIVNVSI